MSELSFPQFNRLPTELRDEIWVKFALPRGPMLHSISYRHRCPLPGEPMPDQDEVEDILLCSFSMGSPGVDLFLFPTTLALMQVSQEARKAVLAGRQPQKLEPGKYNPAVFFGGVYNFENDEERRLLLHKTFFVNWDIDMFYFRERLHLHMEEFLDRSCLLKMKRITLEVRGPCIKADAVWAPDYKRLFNRKSISNMVNLPSLQIIYLALSFRAIRRMYAYEQTLPTSDIEIDSDMEMDPDEEDEEDDSDSEEESDEDSESDSDIEPGEDEAFQPSGPIFDSDDDYDYEDWVIELPKDQYGFHHVEPKTYSNLERPPTRLFSKRPIRQLSLRSWASVMVCSTREDIMKCYEGPVDIQMVMDVYGSICRVIDSYYRGLSGFFCLDEPTLKASYLSAKKNWLPENPPSAIDWAPSGEIRAKTL
ncbi:hypothetical protein F4680DRAFT_468180 [Xylaria scruposa]|nr:hypothetical protein F4680DRAFT_468180 [Xylaria scruposa]